MTRKELLKERLKINNQIDDMLKAREKNKITYDKNEDINKLKGKYNFINNLIKVGITK